MVVKEALDHIRLEVKTLNSDKHIAFVTNRIYGGLQAGGMFELHFLLERKPMPSTTTIEVWPDGTEKETSRSKGNEIVRENQATGYMSIETFIALHVWMNEKVEEMKQMGIIPAAHNGPDSVKDE